MYKVLILKTDHLPEDGMILEMFDRLGGAEVTYSMSWYEDIEIFIDSRNIEISVGGMLLTDYDFVFFKSWRGQQKLAITLANFLMARAIKFIDSEISLPRHGNKLLQYVLLAENGLPIPSTIYASRSLLNSNLPNYIVRLGLPLIMKDAGASQGQNNYLVENLAEAEACLQKFENDSTILIQKFIPNKFDYRFFVVGNKVGLVLKRTRHEGTHLNNISVGGDSEELTSVSEDLKAIAIKASQIFGRDIAGVDIVDSLVSGKPYILEVNPAPGIFTKGNVSLTNKKISLINQHILEVLGNS